VLLPLLPYHPVSVAHGALHVLLPHFVSAPNPTSILLPWTLIVYGLLCGVPIPPQPSTFGCAFAPLLSQMQSSHGSCILYFLTIQYWLPMASFMSSSQAFWNTLPPPTSTSCANLRMSKGAERQQDRLRVDYGPQTQYTLSTRTQYTHSVVLRCMEFGLLLKPRLSVDSTDCGTHTLSSAQMHGIWALTETTSFGASTSHPHHLQI